MTRNGRHDSSLSTHDAIWRRVVELALQSLSPEAAEFVLKLGFSSSDTHRISRLAAKAQAGTLSDSEQSELQRYMRIGDLMSIMKSKARQALRG